MTKQRGSVGTRLSEVRARVTEGPGELSASVRQAAASGADVPPEARAYTEKIRRHAYKVVDRDVEDLKAAGWSEDQIFELTIAIAVGEGLSRLDHALWLLEEVRK